MFDVFQYIVDILIIIALAPAQYPREIIPRPQRENSHLRLILERDRERKRERERE